MEIERKFLVNSDEYKKKATCHVRIKQGYLINDKDMQARVRVIGNTEAFLTIKSANTDLVRFERETEIPVDMAEKLLKKCNGVIDKERFYVPTSTHTFEIDEFLGSLYGLVLAEVEMNSEDENVFLPDFIGEEVTGNNDYYNATLIKKVSK